MDQNPTGLEYYKSIIKWASQHLVPRQTSISNDIQRINIPFMSGFFDDSDSAFVEQVSVMKEPLPSLMLEIGEDQASPVVQLLQYYHFNSICIYQDQYGRDRCVSACLGN